MVDAESETLRTVEMNKKFIVGHTRLGFGGCMIPKKMQRVSAAIYLVDR